MIFLYLYHKNTVKNDRFFFKVKNAKTVRFILLTIEPFMQSRSAPMRLNLARLIPLIPVVFIRTIFGSLSVQTSKLGMIKILKILYSFIRNNNFFSFV